MVVKSQLRECGNWCGEMGVCSISQNSNTCIVYSIFTETVGKIIKKNLDKSVGKIIKLISP
jgi:hypothetical protein